MEKAAANVELCQVLSRIVIFLVNNASALRARKKSAEMSSNEWLALVLGFLLGIPGSVLGSLISGPLLNFPFSYTVVKWVSGGLDWSAPTPLRYREWVIEWEVQSKIFPESNKSALTFYPFLNTFAAEWASTDRTQNIHVYRMVGRLVGANKMTARWFDKEMPDQGYLGALQMIIPPVGGKAHGAWIGFSSQQTVKTGAISLSEPTVPIPSLIGYIAKIYWELRMKARPFALRVFQALFRG